MLSNPCPACRSANRPTARRCEACGAALGDFDTVPSPLAPAAQDDGADAQVGALWFDDLVPAAGPPRLRPALPATPAPTAKIAAPARAAISPMSTAPGLPGLTVREILPGQREPAADSAAARFLPPTPLPADRAARAAIKKSRRAAVRHARQAAALPQPGVIDVLVMHADAAARNQLDDVLVGLGFQVRPVATLAQATLLAGFHPFAAVFVAVPPGAIDGAVHDLFERAREVCRHQGLVPAVRVLLAAQWSPVDRVRAELAGCEATLTCPASRRDLARVLDANGVVLPRDPRRG